MPEEQQQVWHPSSYISDEMRARHWSIEDLAEEMDVHTDEVKNVLWAELPVTEEFAEGLSRAFGTSKEMWLNLQKQFDESE